MNYRELNDQWMQIMQPAYQRFVDQLVDYQAIQDQKLLAYISINQETVYGKLPATKVFYIA